MLVTGIGNKDHVSHRLTVDLLKYELPAIQEPLKLYSVSPPALSL